MDKRRQNLSNLSIALAETATELCKCVQDGQYIRVISHLDADGLAAASIIAKTLNRMNVFFRIRICKQVDSELIKELSNEKESPVVFTDLGSGSLDLLDSLQTNNVFVLDHHQPMGTVFPRLNQINPHLFDFDGSVEVSGAGVSYLLAKEIDGSNTELASLAIIGALGDCQDRFDNRSLGGLNALIVEDAVESGHLRVDRNDLLLHGRETRPIHKALAYTTNPYIPGLSGEEDRCLAFLTNLNISVKTNDRWRAVNDLSNEEKKRLFSELAKYLASQHLDDKVALSLLGTAYTLVKEERGSSLRDGREHASLLNACGRMRKPSLGIALGLGNRTNLLDEVQVVFVEYKRMLSEYLKWLEKNPNKIESLRNIYVVDGSGVIDEYMLSTITSIIVSSNRFEQPKPVIAFTSTKDGTVKFSGRLPEQLRILPLNLGTIFHEASILLDGVGGGHDVAAGAQIPIGREMDFAHFVDEHVGVTLNHAEN